MDDLIERLRAAQCDINEFGWLRTAVAKDAADEIERLREHAAHAQRLAEAAFLQSVALRRELASLVKERDGLQHALLMERGKTERADADNQRLRDALDQYKAAAPLCDNHKPNGGARAACLVCGLIELNSAISRIDYALGEPNEYEVSGYDVHCNPEPVVIGAANVRHELAEAREALRRIADDPAVRSHLDSMRVAGAFLAATSSPPAEDKS